MWTLDAQVLATDRVAGDVHGEPTTGARVQNGELPHPCRHPVLSHQKVEDDVRVRVDLHGGGVFSHRRHRS